MYPPRNKRQREEEEQHRDGVAVDRDQQDAQDRGGDADHVQAEADRIAVAGEPSLDQHSREGWGGQSIR
jgi:hypothetical protein